MKPSSPHLLIHNARLFTPDRPELPGWLLIENGLIQAIGYGLTPDFSRDASVRLLDAGEKRLLPGFIDVHVHWAI